jgi:arabinose-5-phosphate isomerase
LNDIFLRAIEGCIEPKCDSVKKQTVENIAQKTLTEARQVLRIEAEGILNLIDRLDDHFVCMVELIYASKGRVIVSGIGKSGIIGRKIVATLNSTGTRALFLHPVEAMHGDLGIVDQNDIFIALSSSGETDELNILIPRIKSAGCKVIAFTGKSRSTLAKHSDLFIDVGVQQEACPLGLAPTASSTALLAIGDALAVVLINRKNFKPSDFRRFHPGGALGQRLAAKIHDIMQPRESIPVIKKGASLPKALSIIDAGGLGATLVLGDDDNLIGIITDGDIRRLVVLRQDISGLGADEVMSRDPKFIHRDQPVVDALNIMEKYQITVLPVVAAQNRVCGILHLHTILGKGEFKINGL